jgi:hypothetical protein
VRKIFILVFAGIIIVLGVCFGVYKYFNQQSIIRPGDPSKGEYEFALYYKDIMINPACLINFIFDNYEEESVEEEKGIDEDFFDLCIYRAYKNEHEIYIYHTNHILAGSSMDYPLKEGVFQRQFGNYLAIGFYGYDNNTKKIYIVIGIIEEDERVTIHDYILKFIVENNTIKMKVTYHDELIDTL